MIGFSKDGRFMVKEINQADHDSLLFCCENLCKRALEGGSLLAPTLAHFTRAKDGKTFFATLSCVPTHHGFTCSRYDLKGNMDDKTELWDGEKVQAIHNRCFNFAKCWYGCDAEYCKCLQRDDRRKYVLGKRHAFSCPFNVTPKQRSSILDSLGKDVDMLNTCGTMDYSLLVTIIKTTEAEITELGELPKSNLPNQPIVCVDPDDGRIVAYYIGIIDYLQQWTLGKKIAHLVKCCCAPHPISTVPPLAYRHQFFDHFDVKFRAVARDFVGILRTRRPDPSEAGAGIVPLVADAKLTESKTSERISSTDTTGASAAAAPVIADY